MKPGYYWVKYRYDWAPAEYCAAGYWQLIGYEGPVCPDDIKEIGEEITR